MPSRTTAVVDALLRRLQTDLRAEFGLIEIANATPHLLRALSRADLDPAGEAIVRRIETADLLVVGTPVYRGSYSGAFKHVFDLVDYRALAGKTVILAATGGSPHHGLVLEHELRPLFGFFGAFSVPAGVYGLPDDFQDGEIVGAGLQDRIAKAASEAVSLLRARQSHDVVAAAVN